jgi:hypothetical protein
MCPQTEDTSITTGGTLNDNDRTPDQAEFDDIAAHERHVPRYPSGALGSRLRSVVGRRPLLIAGMAVGMAISAVPNTETMSIG